MSALGRQDADPTVTQSCGDLQRLADICDASRLSEGGDPLPMSVLHDLIALIPCDRAGFVARQVRAAVGSSPVMVATSGTPGSVALMTAPDADAGYLALVPNDFPFENQVAARIGLDIALHFPGQAAS